jgi:hypothetical protein
MEKLIFDSGVKEYQLGNGGILRFNPSDPNVYARFMAAMDKLPAIEQELVDKAKTLEQSDGTEPNGTEVLKLMEEADHKIKKLLNEVFDGGNDFHEILGGVNLLAVAGNQERVITNLLAALQPIMVSGAEKCAQQKVGAAVAKAQQNRAQRRCSARNRKRGRK